MMMKSVFVAALACGANALNVVSDEMKNRPVSKVITLLKDMQKQLEKEAEADEAIYDKMVCWCKTNDAEKTKAIKDAEERIAMLTAAIEEGTGKAAALATEMENLEKEIAANQAALAKATSLRQKQLAEFNAEEKDLLQSIQALSNALTVLAKHNQSFLQTEEAKTGTIVTIAHVLKHSFKQHKEALLQVITPSQHSTINQFIQAALSGKADAPAYANQSGEIFGILGNMKDTFEANLSTAQKDEMAAQKAYTELKAAKEDEIAAGQEQLDTKTDEHAATVEKVASDKEDREDTQNTMSADEKYLMNLKEKCKQTDQEMEARQKTRTEEISAVGEALKFLSSDDAHDLFTRTFNFVQVASSMEQNLREKAAAVLKKFASNPKMSAIAQKVKLDAFTKVKKAIDDMVAALLAEKADEIKLKDFCIDALNKNESETSHEERNKADYLAEIDALKAAIQTLATEISDLENAISETKVEMKKAGEIRQAENVEFQATVQDQRATKTLLTQALNVLKSFYEKSAGTAFVQQPAGPPPPAGFKSYENNAGGGGVIGMITQIINDADKMEQEAVMDEKSAQKAYETEVKDSNASIKEMERSIVNKSETKAKTEGDLTTAESNLSDTKTELELLANENADLHKSCDFTLKNFDIRQQARDEEVEALRQAKSILSGMK